MKTSSPYPLPEVIRAKLSELRGLIGRLIACQGLVVLGIWLLAAFWTFGWLDYLPARFGADESPRIVRLVMLAILLAGVVAIAYHFFWNRWLVHWSDSSLALAIEKQHPEFRSALVTTVQAAAPTAKSQRPAKNQGDTVPDAFEHPLRPGVLALAREEAVQKIVAVDVPNLVRMRTLQWELIGFACVAALSGVMLLMAPSWTWHWGNRLFALSDAPWPRTTRLGLSRIDLEVPAFSNQSTRERYSIPFREGGIRVPKGISCQLKAWAERLPAPPYDGCTLHYRDRAGNRGRANLRRGAVESGQQTFLLDGPPLESLSDSLWLTLAGGDARLSNIHLEAVDAPLVLDTQVVVEYPEYLQRSTKTVWGKESLPYRNGLRIPQGSQLALAIRANKPIARCEVMQLRSGETNGPGGEVTEFRFENPSIEFPLPLGVLDSNLLAEVRLWDNEGLCATRVQQFVIAEIADNPPQVDFVLEGIGTAITENAMLPVRSKIADDYDLNQAWIESIIDEQPTVRFDLAWNAQGQANIDLDLRAMRDAGQNVPNVGSVLALMVSASDFFDRDGTPHVGRATPIQLSVVTPDQLLVILERRELAMRARLEQILGELGQLRDVLVLMNRPLDPQPAPASEASDANSDGSEAPAEDPAARRARILALRSQQASAQADKSEGELLGVRNEIQQIVAELINNRVDSKDRRERLEQKIQGPLAELLARQWTPFAKGIGELEAWVTKAEAPEIARRLEQTIEQNNQIIAALTIILNDMIDIQDFNEVIDMVRGMLEDQNQVLERTKEEQKKRLLELLK